MTYKQLINPDLSVIGQPEFCLVYVREVFGVYAKYATALEAWQNAQYKHAGQQPPSAAVPIWFSLSNPAGHVAVWNNGKVYSTTAKGDKTFPSIQGLMDYIGEGIKYLGWSEDINGVRVVEPQEEQEMPNEGDVVNAYHYVGETATPTDVQVYVNKPWNAPDGLFYGKIAVDIANMQKQLAAAQNGSFTPYSGAQLYTKQ